MSSDMGIFSQYFVYFHQSKKIKIKSNCEGHWYVSKEGGKVVYYGSTE